MGNGFCDEITFRIESLDDDCRKFVQSKINEIEHGVILGHSVSEICKNIGLCGDLYFLDLGVDVLDD